jgi:hypothetical protein
VDPNKTLENIRELIKAANSDPTVIYEDGGWMFLLIEELDGWLSKGGFLPDRWVGGERFVACGEQFKVIDTSFDDNDGEYSRYTVWVEEGLED